MKRFILFSLFITLFVFTKPVLAQQAVNSNQLSHQVEAKQLDKEAKILADYFALHNSPLEAHAQDFIDAAKMYNLDWRLVASIAGVESTFGKFIPGGYNGWGWGVYGTQAIYFESWKDGIYTVSKGLRENYMDKGYVEPYSMNRIYAASPTWGSRVTFFMNEIEKFSVSYLVEGQSKSEINTIPKIAVDSGQLTSN